MLRATARPREPRRKPAAASLLTAAVRTHCASRPSPSALEAAPAAANLVARRLWALLQPYVRWRTDWHTARHSARRRS